MPRPTEAKQTDIEQALQYTIDQVFKEVYSAEVIERAKQTYYRVYTPPPPEHLRFYTHEEIIEKIRQEQKEAGLQLIEQVLPAESQLEENTEPAYHELVRVLEELISEAEAELFREQAYERYGWKMEPGSSGLSVTYDPDLAPPGQEVNFAKQAITLFALYKEGVFGEYQYPGAGQRREKFLTEYKKKLRLNKADLSQDITELSKECYSYIREAILEDTRKTIEERFKRKEQELEKRERSLQKKTGKYRKASHLVDSTLKRETIALRELSRQTQNEAERRAGIDRIKILDRFMVGVVLSKGEHKVLECLSQLLHERSSNVEKPDKENYYTGNTGEFNLAKRYTFSEHVHAPQLRCSVYELAKMYKGGATPSGRDQERVGDLVRSLSKKPHLIRYIYEQKGKPEKRVVESLNPLVRIIASDAPYDKETGAGKPGSGFLLMELNPLFVHQIAGKYVVLPGDYLKRIYKANGSTNVSEVVFMLVNYLAREHSNKRTKAEIGIQKLQETVAPKLVKQRGRQKHIEKHLLKACQVCKDIGLLKSYTFNETDQHGKPKAIFYLHKKWE